MEFAGTSIISNSETVMTIGQFSEMFLLPFLPWFLRKMGMKWVLAMGMAAWGIRYLLFALGADGSRESVGGRGEFGASRRLLRLLFRRRLHLRR